MEKILRQCYKEREIKANSIVYQNRIASIERIIENGIFDETEWKSLTNWMLLKKENKDVEDILIKLEENFCQEDVNFTIEKMKRNWKSLLVF